MAVTTRLRSLSRPVNEGLQELDQEASAFKRQGPLPFMITRVRVLTAIDFYNDLCIRADKIRDITQYWNLSSEFEAVEASVAQMPPKELFCISLVAPQSPGNGDWLAHRHGSFRQDRRSVPPLIRPCGAPSPHGRRADQFPSPVGRRCREAADEGWRTALRQPPIRTCYSTFNFPASVRANRSGVYISSMVAAGSR